MRVARRYSLTALALAGALALAACGSDDEDPPAAGGTSSPSGSAAPTGGTTDGTLVFGASSDPVSLDGAYTSDGESARIQRQIFETLVTTKPGGTEVEPLLAKTFTPSTDGKTWTFVLNDGVKFHDGTALDAAAVCFNFDRWYNFKGLQQSPSVSYYWQTVFSGFAKNESKDLTTSLYSSCKVTNPTTLDIVLSSPSASFLAGLALPAFSIASPKALTDFGADTVTGTGDAPVFGGEFGKTKAIGSGPFKLSVNEPGQRIVLERNDDYWGAKAKLKTLIFRPIADGPARKTALLSGSIQGYDLVDPADLSDLESKGYQLLSRPAFNVGYLGFNTAKAPMDNPKIRQAVAYAINRQALVTANYPPGSAVAKEFMPPELFGYADDVTTYDYSVDKAKQAIAESGVTNPTLEFWYPTNVSRPYMPDPEANYQAMKADLEAAGFKVTTKSDDWANGYLDTVQSGGSQLYLFGWTGDFGDPDNFVGTFFRTKQPQWGPIDPTIYTTLEKARTDPNETERTATYQEANKKIMDFLPGLPYVHTSPRLVLAKGITGYVPSPVALEDFSTVSLP